MISRSFKLRIPQVRGTERTSRVEEEGRLGRSHSFGIRDCRSACLRWAIACHVGVDIVRIGLRIVNVRVE